MAIVLGYSRGDLFPATMAGEAERLYCRLALMHTRSIGGEVERTNRLGQARRRAWWRFVRRNKAGQ